MNTKTILPQLLQERSFVRGLPRFPGPRRGRKIYICLQGSSNGYRQLCQRNRVASKLSLIGYIQIVLGKQFENQFFSSCAHAVLASAVRSRSEERRVGKECE